jgi:dynein light intermediate chain 1
LLRRQSLKHNVIDRDKILVPANWDSWGKIRIIREGFDMEGVGTGWSIEIQQPPEPLQPDNPEERPKDEKEAEPEDDGSSAVAIYEQTIQDPKRGTISLNSRTNDRKIEIETMDHQQFLARQCEMLEKLKAEDENLERQARKGSVKESSEAPLSVDESGRVNEHIGPVQFNMGGIQVDADDMLKKLRVSIRYPHVGRTHRANYYTGERSKPDTQEGWSSRDTNERQTADGRWS